MVSEEGALTGLIAVEVRLYDLVTIRIDHLEDERRDSGVIIHRTVTPVV
jgi:hypothetical protein